MLTLPLATERLARTDGRVSKRTATAWTFGRKLTRWLDDNRRERAAGRTAGPGSPPELGTLLKVTAQTVRDWKDDKSVPGGESAATLEQLMGAPWWYLLDPKAPAWPPTPDSLPLIELASVLSPEKRARLYAIARDPARLERFLSAWDVMREH